jgi:2-oxoglutarate ferredoxin oxidoreductase subunit gamma
VGNLRAANIVRLAAFVTRSGVVSMEALRNCIRQKRGKKPKLIPLNMKAVDAGEQAAPK